jgi:uncharacterized protein YecT (DUF1311 family)
MSQDHLEDPAVQGGPPGHGRLVAAGVLGALILGVGLGLWARPVDPAVVAAREAAARPTGPIPGIQIVVDDTPAPIGLPLEVLPAESYPAIEAPRPAPPSMAEPVIPRRAPSGLMRVDAPVAVEPLLAPPEKVEPRPVAKPPAKAKAKPKAEPRPKTLKIAKASSAKKAKTKPTQVAKAKPPKVEKKAPARADGGAKPVKLAKVKPKTPKKLEQARASKGSKIEKVQTAEAKPRRLAMARVAKAPPRKLKVQVVKVAPRKPVRLAEAKTKVKPRAGRPSKLKVERASAARPPARAKPAQRGTGPMRIAKADACASPDAGEALVCGDRRLGARDRQLQRAYRDAEAAGVPTSALRRQQARWVAARAAAAREAPWAVEDVYEARLSELSDLTRDARDN